MSTNFNDTIPAAPAGNTNVQWQTDGAGNDSAYVPTSIFTPADVSLTSLLPGDVLVWNGSIWVNSSIPIAEVAAVDLTGQTANLGSTLVYAVPESGMYKCSIFIIVTQAATTSSTLPSVNILFTDVDNSTAQTLLSTVTNPGNLLTTFEQAEVVVYAKIGTNINFSTTGLASVGGTALNYALHIRVQGV